MITISAGTFEKTSRVSSECIAKSGSPNGYELKIQNEKVSITISADGHASGGDLGTYGVRREAQASFPMQLIVKMVIEGLMCSEYELSSTEVKKLLLAVASSLPDYSNSAVA